MLRFIPVNGREAAEKLFGEYGVEFLDGAAGYEAFDGEKKIGACLFRIVGAAAEILLIDPATDIMLCDALTRSVINYAAGRGAFAVSCRGEKEKKTLRALGFMGDGDDLDIFSVMSGCKHCK